MKIDRRRVPVIGVAVALCSLALIVPTTAAAAKPSLNVSVTADANCHVTVTGTWTPVPGQMYPSVWLDDIRTDVVELQVGLPTVLSPTDSTVSYTTDNFGTSPHPLATGRRVFRATVYIRDANLQPLVTGTKTVALPCDYGF